ncbi:unnamed protein product [Heterobilharzia americana]|nr:unnamed protein product [Heterobilharzia americana]
MVTKSIIHSISQIIWAVLKVSLSTVITYNDHGENKHKNEGILSSYHHSLRQSHQHLDQNLIQGEQDTLERDPKRLGNISSLHPDISNSLIEKSCIHKHQNGLTVPENQTLLTTVKGRIPIHVPSLNPEEYYVRTEGNLRDHPLKIDKISLELKQANDKIKNLEKCLLEKQSTVNELLTELDHKTALVNSLTSESSTKDILLRQLDSTLGHMTRSWKDHEAQQDLSLKLAKESESRRIKELEDLRSQHQLAHTQWDEQLNSLKADHQLEKISLEEQLLQMTSKCKELERQHENANQTILVLECKINKYEDDLRQSQIKLTEQQQTSSLIVKKCVQLKEHWQNQMKKYKDLIKKNYEAKKDEISKLKDEISTSFKRLENEFEDHKKQIDAAAEQKIHAKVLSYEKRIQENTKQAEENMRNKLREASDRYREEIDQLRVSVESELSRQVSEAECRIEVERQRVQNAEKQSEQWRIRAREAEEARSALALQINELLQARCTEAMQILRSNLTVTSLDHPTINGCANQNAEVCITAESRPVGCELVVQHTKRDESERQEEPDKSLFQTSTCEIQVVSNVDKERECQYM